MAQQDESLSYSLSTTRFERNSWLVQRVGWVAIGVVLAAAVGGLLGDHLSDAVVRPALIYVSLLVIFRLTGKRAVGEISTFDFLLLLIISEAVSSALVAEDTTVSGALIAAATLVALDLVLTLAKQALPTLDRVLEDEPVVLYLDGKLQEERLRKERVGVDDILEAARELHGLTSLDQVRCAVLERRGRITIIPLESGR